MLNCPDETQWAKCTTTMLSYITRYVAFIYIKPANYTYNTRNFNPLILLRPLKKEDSGATAT